MAGLAVAGSESGVVRARSRRGLDLLGPFPELASVEIPDGVVVDGEIEVEDTSVGDEHAQRRQE